MIIERQLYQGELIYLAAIDYEKDPPVEAVWTDSSAYWAAHEYKPPHPLSPSRIKKRYEALEKEAENRNNSFYFTIRTNQDDRLVGFVRLNRIDWRGGSANLWILIGKSDDRNHGYGGDALRLILHYAFAEMNLHRLNAWVSDSNQDAIRFLAKAGFVEEVRRRKALFLEGNRWDYVQMGLLRSEWLEQSQVKEIGA